MCADFVNTCATKFLWYIGTFIAHLWHICLVPMEKTFFLYNTVVKKKVEALISCNNNYINRWFLQGHKDSKVCVNERDRHKARQKVHA